MDYRDEEILKAKKEREQDEKAQESIYDEKIHLMGYETKFTRRDVDELKVSIYMPDEFFLLPDDVKKMVYPNGNAPSHVYGGEHIDFQLAMSQTVHKVPDNGMKEFIEISSKMMQAVGPKITIIEKKVQEKQKKNGDIYHIGTLSFVSRAVDMMVFNVQFYISINGQLLLGTIVFPSKHKKRMIKVAYEMIESIEILDDATE